MPASEPKVPRPVSRKKSRKGIDRLQSLPLELLLLVSLANSMWCRIIISLQGGPGRSWCSLFEPGHDSRPRELTIAVALPVQQIAFHISEYSDSDSDSDQCDSLAALLALSTVSRSWRSLILGPACERLWLVAIEKAGLPELEAPPPNLVQYANLVVGRQCKVRSDALRRAESGPLY